MTTLLLHNLKLIMLFLLVGSVIGLSYFSGENRNGSGLATTQHMDSSARARKILVASGRLAATADRTGFVPEYDVRLRQRSLKPSFG